MKNLSYIRLIPHNFMKMLKLLLIFLFTISQNLKSLFIYHFIISRAVKKGINFLVTFEKLFGRIPVSRVFLENFLQVFRY